MARGRGVKDEYAEDGGQAKRFCLQSRFCGVQTMSRSLCNEKEANVNGRLRQERG